MDPFQEIWDWLFPPRPPTPTEALLASIADSLTVIAGTHNSVGVDELRIVLEDRDYWDVEGLVAELLEQFHITRRTA
ncbi:hypothetical protein JRC04_05420 [Mycolicibacterium sp. S2-37]|uniref:hypothetical protein n=1 Tax=Mycolicibacterium sp. S2-37 TaxID=2810297 RepID=UPI001A94ED39|nr:hypothetical protein [Mycolicibacterium sp. S2-37]MBO0676895.1 hypothetical protein [Mycolicibacterium sp. S2-37]